MSEDTEDLSPTMRKLKDAIEADRMKPKTMALAREAHRSNGGHTAMLTIWCQHLTALLCELIDRVDAKEASK